MKVQLRIDSILNPDSKPKEYSIPLLKGLQMRNFSFYAPHASSPDQVRLIAAGLHRYIETIGCSEWDPAVVITRNYDEAHEYIADRVPVLYWPKDGQVIQKSKYCTPVSNWWDIYQALCTIQSGIWTY